MTTLEILVAMRELLADESRWTKHLFARDRQGFAVSPCDNGAVCWCLYGAHDRVNRGGSDRSVKAALRRVGVTTGLATFNDEHTHAQVLAKLDEAIELERAA